MDVNDLLKDIKNLYDYVAVTQDVSSKRKTIKVALNISTVFSLKKIRSFEIEYFKKYKENGVACIVMEKLLGTPPGKAWAVLTKELVCVLHCWLEAIRKDLISHTTHWWTFMGLIIKFIRKIVIKDSAIPNMLVELTARGLLALATAPRPTVCQRHEILHCLNSFCANSGRETRIAIKPTLSEHLVSVAANMASTGYLPLQCGFLECLVRWVVPRHEPGMRAAAADKWLPSGLCPPAARSIFVNSDWINFFRTAREFLNALNKGNGLVTSVICRQLSIEKTVVVNGTERLCSWLDFNTCGKSVSLLLLPVMLEALGVREHAACEALVIDSEITETALLLREPQGLTIKLTTLRAPCIRPADVSTGDGRLVTIVISSRTDLATLNRAMTAIFGDKYQCMVDLDCYVASPPTRSYRNQNASEEDSRFSHPVEAKRQTHSATDKRANTGRNITQSSSSSTSLNELKHKLQAIPPQHIFEKDVASVCKQPALSNVTELTEYDDIYTNAKRKPGYRSFKKTLARMKSKSDEEPVSQRTKGDRQHLPQVVSDDTSLLAAATVNSTGSIVSMASFIEVKISDDNIVDLIVQEALQAKPKSKDVTDSGINTDEMKSHEEIDVIEDTSNEIKETISSVPLKKKCTIISKSSSYDESTTEAINETPAFVNTRMNIQSRNKANTLKETEKQKSVEKIFSQHSIETRKGEIAISPSLARKIKETSSETTLNFNEPMNEAVNTDVEQSMWNNIEIVNCVNDATDKVSSDKCYNIYKESLIAGTNETVQDKESEKKVQSEKRNPPEKLKNKHAKKAKALITSKSKKVGKESTKKMSTIIEQKQEEIILEEINPKIHNENVDVVKLQSPKNTTENPEQKPETPLVRRKRKLYSPKDDDFEDKIQYYVVDEDGAPLSKTANRNGNKTPKTTATCYKEIGIERKNNSRLLRSKNSKSKTVEIPSPRTCKINSIFDSLKQNNENNEQITLVDKNTDIYNYTSDSEDDDFIKKKMVTKKLNSSVNAGSSKSIAKKKNRNIRGHEGTETSYEEAKKAKTGKRKKFTKRTSKRMSNSKVPIEHEVNLIDERMREPVREELNTSILIENPVMVPEADEIEPVLKELFQMEEIHDNVPNTLASNKTAKNTRLEQTHVSESNDTLVSNQNSKNTQIARIRNSETNETLAPKNKVDKRIKNTKQLSTKKQKRFVKRDKTVTISDKEDGETISPLPGLVVESMPNYREDINDSFTTNLSHKFKRIYEQSALNDSVNTQNMLTDADRLNSSAQGWINIVDDENFVDNKGITDGNAVKEKKAIQPKTIKKTAGKRTKQQGDEIIEILDTVDIHEENNNQMDMSISTNGIQAHADFDEAPPAPDTIIEHFVPRAYQDLSPSMKDYFTILTGAVHSSASKDRRSSKSVEGEKVCNISRNEIKNNKSIISPVVSVKRLSLEDLRQWIPSRRTSDTNDSQPSSQKILNQTKRIPETSPGVRSVKISGTTPKTVAQNKNIKPAIKPNTESIKLKPPIVPMERMFFEEFNKWYYTDATENQTDAATLTLQKQKAQVKTKPDKEITQPKRIETDDTSDSDQIDWSDSVSRHTRSRSQPKKTKQSHNLRDAKKPKTRYWNTVDSAEESTTKNTRSTKFEPKRMISPIVLIERFAPVIENDSSADNEPLKRKESMITRSKDPKDCSQKSITSALSLNVESPELKRTGPSLISVRDAKRRVIEPKVVDEGTSRINESKRTDERSVKIDMTKRIVADLQDVAAAHSNPSTVHDWLSAGSTNQRDNNAIRDDALHYILERLDTTVTENDERTKMELIKLFMEMMKYQNKFMEETESKMEQERIRTIHEFQTIIERLTKLSRDVSEGSSGLMEKIKDLTKEFITHNTNSSKSCVKLLKEEVLAMIERRTK